MIYHPDGQRFLTSIEMDQQIKQERQRVERLEEYLRSQGVEPHRL